MIVRAPANDPHRTAAPAPRRSHGESLSGLGTLVPALRPDAPLSVAAATFSATPSLFALAVVDSEDRPIGLISRMRVQQAHGVHAWSEPVSRLMDPGPLVVDEAAAFDSLCDALLSDAHRHLLDGFIVTRAGSYVRVASGQDVLRRLAERRDAVLFHMTHHDPLTDLPNRELFDDRLQQALARARRAQRAVAVLLLDVDRLKAVNDSLGHGVGDRLLGAFAGRLRRLVREQDTVARVSGDKFGIILGDLAEASNAEPVAGKILDACRRPYDIEGMELNLSCSIGIAAFPDDGEAQPALLKAATDALHAAKQVRHTWQRYSRTMRRQTADLPFAFSSVRRALEEDRFSVHYQPILSVATGAVTGVEALVRWFDPERGLMSTTDLVRVAEDTGLIVPISERVMRAAMRQAAGWRRADGEPLTLSLNVSGVQFRNGGLVTMVSQLLEETGFPASSLLLEITESTAMHSAAATMTALYQLRALGIRLAIDDFGAGYSSMSRLNRLPVDALKIDRSFVMGIGESADQGIMATAIITMARALGLKVTAEGVETRTQLSLLASQACDEAQGFLLSRPLPPDELTTFLERHRQACWPPG